jgi:hypothetical protein
VQSPDRLFDLLASYEEVDEPLSRFFAVWSEGRAVKEVARILGFDPEAGEPGQFSDLETGPYEDGVRTVLIGQAGDWTLAVGDQDATGADTLAALSRDGGRALSLDWAPLDDDPKLRYAIDGELVTCLNLIDPDDRSGADPLLWTIT